MIIKDQLTKVIYSDTPNKKSIQLTFFRNSIWMTQIDIAKLYDVQRLTIKKHLKNAYKTSKLIEKEVVDYVKETYDTEVIGKTKYYNLTAIKNIGHRINSSYVLKLEEWLKKR